MPDVAPVQTTAFSTADLFRELIGGATTVLAARELSKSSGAAVVNAATDTKKPDVAKPTDTGTILGMPPQTALLAGGLALVGLVAVVLIVRK